MVVDRRKMGEEEREDGDEGEVKEKAGSSTLTFGLCLDPFDFPLFPLFSTFPFALVLTAPRW